jgi:hypothetical protein
MGECRLAPTYVARVNEALIERIAEIPLGHIPGADVSFCNADTRRPFRA